nr:hypothetical protein [uncultured Flavobacterium sp.]
MSKPGNYTAYQQYKPQDNGTIQAIQHWSGFAEQKRQNDLAQEQKDRQIQNQEDKDKQANLDKWLSYESIPMTGVENVDMAHAKIAAADRTELQRLVGELVKTPDKFSEQGISLQMQIDKIQKNPAVIKAMVSAPLKLAQEYFSGADTKYVRTPENENFFANLKDAKFTRNSNGDPAFIIKDPKDNTKEIVLTEAEILNLEKVTPLIPKFDWDKLVKDNAEILNKKPHSKTEIDPTTGYLVTSEGYDEPTVSQIATNMFSDKNGKPTEYAISFLAQKGIHDIKDLPYEKLQELEQQFVTDITPFLVSKEGIKTNTNEIQKQKLAADIANKKAKLAQGQQVINLKASIAAGKGELKTPVTINDFKQLPKPDGKGRIGFNVVDNALTVSYGVKGNQVERKVTGIWVNPKNNKDVKINYIETGKKPDAYGTAQPYSEKGTFDSKTDGEMAGTFSAELGQTIEELSASLVKKVKPKTNKPKTNKPKTNKPKETLQERKKRLGLK